jgi:hypothetical protein
MQVRKPIAKTIFPEWFYKTIQKPTGESAKALKLWFYALGLNINKERKKHNILTI